VKTKLSKFGTVHPIGLEALQRIIENERALWTKPDLIEEYQCYSRLRIEDNSQVCSVNDFYDLILHGVTRDGLMLAQAEKPDVPLYTVIRTCEDKCFKDLGQAGRIVVIVGLLLAENQLLFGPFPSS
jgi:hypothetical protein